MPWPRHPRALQDRVDPPARPWKGLDEVESATLEWVDWFNHRRLLEPIGQVPPAELEAAFWGEEAPNRTAALKDSRVAAAVCTRASSATYRSTGSGGRPRRG